MAVLPDSRELAFGTKPPILIKLHSGYGRGTTFTPLLKGLTSTADFLEFYDSDAGVVGKPRSPINGEQ